LKRTRQPLTPTLSPQAGRGREVDKAALRVELRAAREAVEPAQAAVAAEKIAQGALDFLLERTKLLDPEQTPVALYAALPGELDCLPLLQALTAKGFPTLLPVAGTKAAPLTFRRWRPGEPLAAGRYGLREPAATAPEMTPKILFAPLLGFDSEGTRLGFGGGYYDATLAYLRGAGLIAAGGLAFACQRAEKIPREAHDEKLDFVVTETEVLVFTEFSCACFS
jgi:5-formyltetrahydrofolate cyclo-ligase